MTWFVNLIPHGTLFKGTLRLKMGNYLLCQKSYAISPDLIFYSVEIIFCFLAIHSKFLTLFRRDFFCFVRPGAASPLPLCNFKTAHDTCTKLQKIMYPFPTSRYNLTCLTVFVISSFSGLEISLQWNGGTIFGLARALLLIWRISDWVLLNQPGVWWTSLSMTNFTQLSTTISQVFHIRYQWRSKIPKTSLTSSTHYHTQRFERNMIISFFF